MKTFGHGSLVHEEYGGQALDGPRARSSLPLSLYSEMNLQCNPMVWRSFDAHWDRSLNDCCFSFRWNCFTFEKGTKSHIQFNQKHWFVIVFICFRDDKIVDQLFATLPLPSTYCSVWSCLVRYTRIAQNAIFVFRALDYVSNTEPALVLKHSGKR